MYITINIWGRFLLSSIDLQFTIFPDFDASGKLPAGLSRGNVNWLGSFDICQDIPARYCLFSFNITSNNQVNVYSSC